LNDEHAERWAFKGFLDVLQSGKALRACIIVRLGTQPSEADSNETIVPPAVDLPSDLPQPVDLTKLVENWKSELASKYKIQPERFVVLFVTQGKFLGNSLETWIVPEGAALPDPNLEDEEQPALPDAKPTPWKTD